MAGSETSSQIHDEYTRIGGDVRRISILAVILLVILRISIGWHLLYEGWWKIDTQNSPTPWTAEGYLRNATGPLRTTFRNLTGDPDDLNYLNYDFMAAKWDGWLTRFEQHYKIDPGSPEGQAFSRMLNGSEVFAVALAELPPGVKPELVNKAVVFDPGSKTLRVDGKQHLLADERDRLIDQAKDDAADSDAVKAVKARFRQAVSALFNVSSKLSFKERLTVLLKSDPDRIGLSVKDKAGNPLEERPGEIKNYTNAIKRYEEAYKKARTKFQFDHLDQIGRDLQEKRRAAVGPVIALEKELYETAEKLLTAEQLSRGPLPKPWTEINKINWRTMWGLTVLGMLLIVGLGTRAAAVAAAGLLSLFYLAAPPWPGVPEAPSIEHNFIVNKIWLEVLTLLAIAAMPTGRWFGIDALFYGLRDRYRLKRAETRK